MDKDGRILFGYRYTFLIIDGKYREQVLVFIESAY